MRNELQIVLTVARLLPADELPQFLGEIEEVRCTALARLVAPGPAQSTGSDELLNIKEACRRLGVSKDYLYRHHTDFAFTRRVGRKLLFSRLGIEKHIRQHDSLTAKRHNGMLSPSWATRQRGAHET
jgi:predicted DNA-binding transcriptional regulator AlpA